MELMDMDWTPVMENPDILEVIFRFLPLNILGRIRLVCKLWDHEARKKMAKKYHIITLNSRSDFKRFKETMDNYVARTTNEIFFKQWSMIFDEITLEDEDVQILINQYGKYVNKLRIRFNWRIEGNFPSTFKQLLVNQMYNLEELEFCGFPEAIWQQTELFDESTPLLLKLKSLSCFSLVEYRHAEECPLYLNILKCLKPNQLDTLKINCHNYMRIIFEEAAEKPHNNMNKLFSRLNGLKTFSMIYPDYYNSIDHVRENCQPLFDRQAITVISLLVTCPKLTKLCLCLASTSSLETVNIICSNLANSLVELQLGEHYIYLY